MRTGWNSVAKRLLGLATICACLAALAVGALSSSGSAVLDCNNGCSGSTTSTNPPERASGSGGTSSNTASSKNARFYDATTNGGVACTGVPGTAGGVFGTAKLKTSTNTESIKVHRLNPNTSYDVNFIDATCVLHPALATFTTDGHGRGSVTFNFVPPTPTGNFTLVPAAGDSFQTKEITF